MALALSRTARHQRIVEILGSVRVSSQAQLLAILSRDGHEVTQATLSRDLYELGAVKVRHGRSLVYAVPGQGGDTRPRAATTERQWDARLRRLCEELVVTAVASANLVVVRTPPGAANYLASALDRHSTSAQTGIIGTVAGDDTVLVVTSDPRGGDALVDLLLTMAGGAGGDDRLPGGTGAADPPRTGDEEDDR